MTDKSSHVGPSPGGGSGRPGVQIAATGAGDGLLRLWSSTRLWPVALLLALGIFVPPLGAAEARTVTVAVVQDGPSAEEALVARVEAELGQFVGVDTTLRFKRDAAFDAAWDPAQARRAVRAALDDPEVDLILGVGALVTNEAARPRLRLRKPFVSTFIQRADVLKLPYSGEGRSLKENFSFMVVPQRTERDIEAFRQLVPFTVLHVAGATEELEYASDLVEDRLQQISRDLGVDIVTLPVTGDVAGSLAQIDGGVEAVYLTRLPRLSLEDREAFIRGLTAKQIATFSMIGHGDVERGAFAALTPDLSEAAARRAALNLNRLSRGESVADLPVILQVDTRLVINAETALAVGYSPSPAVWIQASFLHREALHGVAEPLTYDDALGSAAAANAALAVQDSSVDSARQSVIKARSPLLPQVVSDFSYLDSATPLPNLRGLVPQRGLLFGIAVSQSIYNDGLWTLLQTSQSAAKASEHRRDRVRLEVLEAAGTTFMGLELARSLQRIEASNVELTEDFLDLAKLRVDVGITGKEDVLLWESVLARHRSSQFRAAQRVRTTQMVLNQIMGVEQSRSWTTRDLSGEWETFFALTERVLPILENLTSVERFRTTATDIAIRNSPEMAALDEAISAQDRRLTSAERSFWLPTLSADFTYVNELTGDARNVPGIDDDFWIFGLNVRYPLFRGGARFGERGKAQADLTGLKRQERLVRQQLELNTRTVIEAAEWIYPRIAFSRHATETARENLRIVRDQYGEGTKSITDLLSAQNNLFVAEQLHATAVYEFLAEMVKLQRAIAFFEYDKSAEQREHMLKEFEARVARPEARRNSRD